MMSLTNQQLQDFQEALSWKTGMRLPDGRVLGVAGKRGAIADGIDSRVIAVAERLDPARKTILEVGCCEGIHTVQLAAICRQVVALDVRPKNIACTLVRLFVHGIDNAKVLLQDVRDLDGRFGKFDILFHVGVLYHLMNPVEHLFQIGRLGDDLLLDTHFCTDDTSFELSDIVHRDKRYRAFLYREGGWRDNFSGVEPTSRWLHRDALLQALNDVGFNSVQILSERTERNGPRITLLARKMATTLTRPSPVTGELISTKLLTLETELAATRVEAAATRRELDAARARAESLQGELTALQQSWTRKLRPFCIALLAGIRKAVHRVVW